jgi:hypothetical protein
MDSSYLTWIGFESFVLEKLAAVYFDNSRLPVLTSLVGSKSTFLVFQLSRFSVERASFQAPFSPELAASESESSKLSGLS